MRITHLGHAAVLAETDDARILIDPGNTSDAWHSLTDLDAVLVSTTENIAKARVMRKRLGGGWR
ncbi:MAG TPA: MBL fold metallo-hydrolase, partial [Propionibacteriaceae bacterium]|nr:MBL fold metallo-hydrolase [Propionibacteriaceae bacterium]